MYKELKYTPETELIANNRKSESVFASLKNIHAKMSNTSDTLNCINLSQFFLNQTIEWLKSKSPEKQSKLLNDSLDNRADNIIKRQETRKSNELLSAQKQKRKADRIQLKMLKKRIKQEKV